jgi:ABC-type dipeptide/oligopeptide/nickel transport system permease component
MGQETGAFWRYAYRRMAHAVPLILGVVVVNFTLIQLAPGDPILALIGEYQASPEFVQSVRQQFGLDRPLPVQLGLYLWNLLQGTSVSPSRSSSRSWTSSWTGCRQRSS